MFKAEKTKCIKAQRYKRADVLGIPAEVKAEWRRGGLSRGKVGDPKG